MKKIISITGIILIVLGVCFVIIDSGIRIGDTDILGLVVPAPPMWTSFIPFIGIIIGKAFEMLSLHGLAGIAITGAFIMAGSLFYNCGNINSINI